MRWQEFETACPELAQLAHARFSTDELILIGSIRKDGSPRISPVEPDFTAGELMMGMMWQSHKALDLLRDPRLVIHSVPSDKTNPGGDVKLYGTAVPIDDSGLRGHYEDADLEPVAPAPAADQHGKPRTRAASHASLDEVAGGAGCEPRLRWFPSALWTIVDDRRAAAAVCRAPTEPAPARPKHQRDREPNNPHDQKNHSDRVDADTRQGRVDGPRQDRSSGNQNQAHTDTHFRLPVVLIDDPFSVRRRPKSPLRGRLNPGGRELAILEPRVFPGLTQCSMPDHWENGGSSGGAVGLGGCGDRLGEVAKRGAESSEGVRVEVVRVDD